MSKKLTTIEYIIKSKKVHGDKYDYSLVEYKNSTSKVKIICPKHGVFEQLSRNHINNNQGCPSCANVKPLNTEEFITKSKEIHGDKYDYSLVEYKNNKTKIKIICPKHGMFEQMAGSHLNGYNCSKCSIDESRKKDIFINKSILKYNNKYDYSLVDYKRTDKLVKIICPKHGIFEQTPTLHLKKGCQICEGNMKLNTGQIKIIFNKIHNNKYDYSLVDYKNNKTKIKIICPKHGIFEQRPMSHKVGNGCPKCRYSKGEKEITNLLNQKEIKFVYNKRFQDCKDINELPFDFYLPNENICIEYDGIQHYESNCFFGGDKRLKEQRKKDKIKTDYCKDKNIYLIRIRYDEDIKDKLKII